MSFSCAILAIYFIKGHGRRERCVPEKIAILSSSHSYPSHISPSPSSLHPFIHLDTRSLSLALSHFSPTPPSFSLWFSESNHISHHGFVRFTLSSPTADHSRHHPSPLNSQQTHMHHTSCLHLFLNIASNLTCTPRFFRVWPPLLPKTRPPPTTMCSASSGLAPRCLHLVSHLPQNPTPAELRTKATWPRVVLW